MWCGVMWCGVTLHKLNVYSNMCDGELNALFTPIPSQSRLTELQEQPVVPLYDPSRDALDAAITESGIAQWSF
jgi:hypothetical protein